jgi:thioredoxin-related protein
MKIIKYPVLLLLSFFIVTNAHAQAKPKNAEEIIKEAKLEAAKTNKNIFVMFHASWCVWCHRMDTAMNDETIKSFFDKNYVIKHLTVDESPDKKGLENPGAAALRTKYHGDQQGIPYWFILDKDGKLLADSIVHSDDGKVIGNNVGCPAKPDEVAYFIKVLKKTSDLSEGQLGLVQKRFLKIGQ